MGLLPILKIEDWKTKQDIASQLISFERLYEKSQQSAIIEGNVSYITSSKETQMVVFQYYFKGQEKTEVLQVKQPLTIEKDSDLKLQGGSASPSKLETFSFVDTSVEKRTRYVVQLGSSKVFKYVEKA